MTSTDPLVCSFVIPAFNEEEQLPITLASIRNCLSGFAEGSWEIIVVDNDSTDRTKLIAQREGAKVFYESSRGIARARNRGVAECSGKYVFFLDADTLIPSETFQESFEMLESGRVGAGGATICFDDSQGRLLFGIILPRLWNLISIYFRLAAGSFIFCRKDLFHACGGFPEQYYAGEELFFSRKMKKICREIGLSFKIIRKSPVITSSRKLQWHSNASILLTLLLLVFFPFSIRYRKLCGFWYDRPLKND